MRFLIIGDIVGRSGMNIVVNNIRNIIQEEKIDFVIANGENATGGRGLKEKEMKELFANHVDVITMGNHIYYRKEAKELYRNIEKLLIPANVHNLEGHGSCIVNKHNKKIGVLNVIGKVNMGEINQEHISNPFEIVRDEVGKLKKDNVDYIFIDFHAETTAEKIAMGYYLENDITCLFGTHTHVQTADERIINNKVAYITDVGMCGPKESVLGLKKEIAVKRFLTGEKIKYECSENTGMFSSIIVETDDKTNNAISVKRYNINY